MPSVDAAGTELNYERSGAGEPLLLIQGMSATNLAWGEPFIAALEQRFECIAFDNRGMGASGRAKLPFTITDLAADTAALLDGLGLESAHVLGISMGGMVAQELTLSHPERVRTLSLGATYCGGSEGSLMDPGDVQRLLEAHSSGDPEAVRRLMWELNLSPAFREDDSRYDAFLEMTERLPAPGPVVREQMKATVTHDTSARLAEIEAPTLVIHGTLDRIIGVENGRQIARLMSIEPVILEGVGHMFWWEQPERSAALVCDHALAAA
jgi:pimeloyl-ACP methyl ester carboxylesterase